MAEGTEVGKIYYTLDLDDSGFKDGAKESEKAAGNMGDNIKSVANKAAIGMGVAGAALTVLAKSATDFTVDYVKNSKSIARTTGDTVENASRLAYAFQQMGVNADEANQTFGIFSKKIAAGDDTLKNLGITTKNADGSTKSFNDILLQTADKFAAMPNGVTKTAAAMDLFGRSGKDLLPILNLGSAGIKDLEDKADKLGLTLTASNAGDIQKYIQAQKDLKGTTDSMKIAIGLATAPVLTAFNEQLNHALQNLVGMHGPMRDVTVDVIAFGGPVLTASGAVLGFAANLGTVISTVTELGIGLATFTGFAAFAALAVASVGAIVWAANTIKGAWDAVYNSAAAAANLDNAQTEQQIRDYQKKATAARAAGDTASATKYANAIAALTGGRARGGPVMAGTPYMIGEKGPELFVPSLSGQVVPNNKIGDMGGGASSNYYQYGDIILKDKNDVDYFFQKLNRKTQLSDQRMTA